MKTRILSMITILALLLSACGALAETVPAASIVNLKTEGRVNPVGVDTDAPAFSWQLQSSAIGAAQAAYAITVWDELGNAVWESGAVESAQSNGVLYDGAALEPSSTYTWRVTVTDQAGARLESETATFVTSLLSDSFDAWDGAMWIGASELPLDAASKSVFHISADVTFSEGSDTASFILGADDYRLRHRAFNPKLLEGENYVRVELDLSGLTAAGGAKINVYRVGYDPDDDGSAPFATVGENEELEQKQMLRGPNRRRFFLSKPRKSEVWDKPGESFLSNAAGSEFWDKTEAPGADPGVNLSSKSRHKLKHQKP